ncbi:hypothetical protein RUND412_008484, partial [Rhizina undulata]
PHITLYHIRWKVYAEAYAYYAWEFDKPAFLSAGVVGKVEFELNVNSFSLNGQFFFWNARRTCASGTYFNPVDARLPAANRLHKYTASDTTPGTAPGNMDSLESIGAPQNHEDVSSTSAQEEISVGTLIAGQLV